MAHTEALFNPEISIPSGNIPDLAALRAVWRTLASEEASCPPGHRLGIARRRMELLSAFPAWQIPSLIDALNAPAPQEEVLA